MDSTSKYRLFSSLPALKCGVFTLHHVCRASGALLNSTNDAAYCVLVHGLLQVPILVGGRRCLFARCTWDYNATLLRTYEKTAWPLS